MRALSILLLFLLLGCGGATVEPKNVNLADLPEPVMKTAREKLPDVKFSKAWIGPGGNYSVRGKTKQGKQRTVTVTRGGDFVQVD